MMPENSKYGLCGSHPDFHVPNSIRDVGQGFDGKELARRLKENGADALVFFAKCHYGNSYYPTRIGFPHPGLRSDMLGAITRACHAQKVKLIVYYSTFLDGRAGAAHPDWVSLNADGKPQWNVEDWKLLCVNSPYVEALLIPQCREIIDQYDIDGLFFDTMATLQPCSCEYCRKLYGGDIPKSAEAADWKDWSKWYRKCFEAFFDKVAGAMFRKRPDLPISFNWEWSCRSPGKQPDGIQWLLADSGIEWASSLCRYFSGSPGHFDHMAGRFIHGLGDWNTSPDDMLCQAASLPLAHGGGFWLIDRLLPDGNLDDAAYHAMKKTFDFIRERQEVVEGTKVIADLIVLNSENSLLGQDNEYFSLAETRLRRLRSVLGAEALLSQSGCHFVIVNEHRLLDCLAQCRLLVLPEQEFLDEKTVVAIQEFVRQGGKLLISQRHSRADLGSRLFDLVGATVKDFTTANTSPVNGSVCYSYIDGDPVLVIYGAMAITEKQTAAGLCAARQIRYPECGNGRFGWGIVPPGEKTDYAAILRHAYGQGEVIYIAAPVFESYQVRPSPYLTRRVLELIRRLYPDRPVTIEAPSGVNLMVCRKAEDLIFHLVNCNGVTATLDERHRATLLTPTVPIIQDIVVAIKWTQTAESIVEFPSKKSYAFKVRNGQARFRLEWLHIMTSFRVAHYFGSHRCLLQSEISTC